MNDGPRPAFRVPHTLVLLFGMIVLAWILTQVLPQGAYEREPVPGSSSDERVVPDTYHEIENGKRPSALMILTAIPKGFKKSEGIIFFVFLIGGTFGVLRATGAIDALLGFVLMSLRHRPGFLVAGGMLIFAVGSSTIGMAEEYLPFVPVLIALAIGLGFDAVTAIGILCIGYAVGYGSAAINPFTVLIAQDAAGLAKTSGWALRAGLTLPFLAIGFHHVWRYATRVKADPSCSLVAGIDPPVSATSSGDRPSLNATHLLVLLATAASIGFLVYAIPNHHWYVHEMGAMFVGLTLVIALLARMNPDTVARRFCEGAAELSTLR